MTIDKNQLRKKIVTMTKRGGDVADLAAAVLILNDSIMTQAKQISQLSKKMDDAEAKLSRLRG